MATLARKLVLIGTLVLALFACQSSDVSNVLLAGAAPILSAATLDEAEVAQHSRAMVAKLDQSQTLAPPSSAYHQRLQRLTRPITGYRGMSLNFAVYLDDQVNAFATADGSIRVYSGLMDHMNDAQLMSVIGHELGHVAQRHSYQQMRKAMVARGLRNAVAASEYSSLASGTVGELAETALRARFSQQDEFAADQFGVRFLREQGINPKAAIDALGVLKSLGAKGGGILSSHPSNPERISKLRAQL